MWGDATQSISDLSGQQPATFFFMLTCAVLMTSSQSKAFVDASYAIGYKAIAMQAEGGPPEWDLPYRTIGWAEGWLSGAVYVDKAKWLTKGLATTQWSSRWSGVGEGRTALKGKLPQIQICWFNGLGYETWENVWGTWNGLIERSAEAIRRVGMMLRFFGHRAENFFAYVKSGKPFLPTNLLEDTAGLLRPSLRTLEPRTKQPISVLSGAVAGCDRFLLTSASLDDVIAFEAPRSGSPLLRRRRKWSRACLSPPSRAGGRRCTRSSTGTKTEMAPSRRACS